MSHDFDLAVVGGGSGGVRAARVAASLGARVALVEAARLGGTCIHLGCIPKKLTVLGAAYGDALADMRGYGWTAEGVRFDWATLCAGRDAEVARLNAAYATLLERAGVEVIHGRARLDGPHRVVVGERALTAAHVLVATGGRPLRPSEAELPGAGLAWVSDDVFGRPAFPRRLVVVGGGYVACELATAFHGLGAEVHLVHRGTGLLRGFDEDLRRELAHAVRARGIHLRLGAAPSAIIRAGDGLAVDVGGDRIDADAVLLAVGRKPTTEGLGLAEAGVALAPNGAVRVDDAFRTSVPSVYAVGDVIDRVKLTPVALAEGTVVATNLFGPGGRRMDYRDVPTAVFTLPPIGTVGLPEHEARRLFDRIEVFQSSFTPLRHRVSRRAERALVKVVVDGATDRVLGVHAIGEEAPEIVQGFATALRCGATKADLDGTLGIHPTIAEELVTLRQEKTP